MLNMANYDFSSLSEQKFEDLVQALALKLLGPETLIFGDGPDGGREATYTGDLKISESKTWYGYTVLQAKFRVPSNSISKETDSNWLIGHLQTDLKKYQNPEKPRRCPNNYIIASNVTLTAVQDVGGKDLIAKVFKKFKLAKSEFHEHMEWDGITLCRLLDDAPDIVRTYFADITPSDVLWDMMSRISESSVGPPPDQVAILTDNYLAQNMLSRPVVQSISAHLEAGQGVMFVGPPGSGKTTVIAELALKEPSQFVYVSLENKTTEQVASYIARRLTSQVGLSKALPVGEVPLLEAIESLIQESRILLLLDDCESNVDVSARLSGVPGLTGRTVFVSTVELEFSTGLETIYNKPFERLEVQELLKLRQISLDPGELEKITLASEGNPMYLEYYATKLIEPTPVGLKKYEAALLKNTGSLSYEILNFLSHSLRPLNTDELFRVLNEKHTRRELKQALDELGSCLQRDEQHWRIFHSSFSSFIKEEAAKDGFSKQYYGPLGVLFEGTGEILEAAISKLRGSLEPEEIAVQAVCAALERSEWALAEELLLYVALVSEKTGDQSNVAYSYVGLAEISRERGSHSESLSFLSKAELAMVGQDSRMFKISVESYRALVELESGFYQESISKLQSLIEELTIDELKEKAALCLNLSFVLLNVGRPNDGLEYARLALEFFETCGELRGINNALANISACMGSLPRANPNELLSSADSLIQTGRKQNNKRLLALGFNHAAKAQRKLGFYQEAVDSSREAIRLCQECDAKAMEISNIANLGNALLDQEKVQEARVAYEESLKGAQDYGLIREETHAKELLGKLFLLHVGDLQKAGVLLKDALETYRTLGDRFRTASTGELLGNYYRRTNEKAKAISAYVSGGEDFASFSDWTMAAHCFDSATELLDTVGSLEEASAKSLKAAIYELLDGDSEGKNYKALDALSRSSNVTGAFSHLLELLGKGVVHSEFFSVLRNYSKHCLRKTKKEQDQFTQDILTLAASPNARNRTEVLNALAIAPLYMTWIKKPGEFLVQVFQGLGERSLFYIDPYKVETAEARIGSGKIRIECLSDEHTAICLTSLLAMVLFAHHRLIDDCISNTGSTRNDALCIHILDERKAIELKIPLPIYENNYMQTTFSESLDSHYEGRPIPTYLWVHAAFQESLESRHPKASMAWLLLRFFVTVVSHFTQMSQEQVSSKEAQAFASLVLKRKDSM